MFKTMATVIGLLILSNLNAHAEQLAAREVKGKTMTLPEAIDYLRPSVIQMTMMLDNFSGSAVAAFGGRPFVAHPLGTGFLINEDGYVVTALHVVRAFQAYQVEGRKRLVVGVAAPNLENFRGISVRGNFTQIEFDIVDEDARHDLVLLKLKRNPFKGEIGIFMKTRDESIE
jgi:S1-C subfamily serine protease